MADEQRKDEAQGHAKGSGRSEARFPSYDLTDSLEAVRQIQVRGGGSASPDALASFLGYKNTNNGSYLARVGATRLFGLVGKDGPNFVLTELAHTVISPVYPADAKKGLVAAFFNVDLFKRVYEDHKGRHLPPEEGMKNALRNTYKVTPGRVDLAYRVLMTSADAAGMFETRNGAPTHLIIPTIAAPAPEDNPPAGGVGVGQRDGRGGKGGGAPPLHGGVSQGLEEVKARYLETLIKLFEAKAEQGDIDDKLMERIERLLGVNASGNDRPPF